MLKQKGSTTAHYVGRFAPSPTGPLHLGSLTAALASWLDARASRGRWLVRIEDADTPRCVPGAAELILSQLAVLGLQPDAPPEWQSRRDALYEEALSRLSAAGWAFPCGCTRAEIEAHWLGRGIGKQRHAEWPYPGTCRSGLHGQAPRAWRVRLRRDEDGDPLIINWTDRRLGPQVQDVTHTVSDFVLRRADGLWAYQLAVVVDDGAQGVTHVVRGEDLADNTPRQIHLQSLLGLQTPVYLHTPLVLGPDGEKLSKQHGAPSLSLIDPMRSLRAAAATLGLATEGHTMPEFLDRAVNEWRVRFPSD